MGDTGCDKLKVWSLEKNDIINVLFYEFIDRDAGGAAAGAAYNNLDAIRWDVKQVTITGATNMMHGFAALLLASLF